MYNQEAYYPDGGIASLPGYSWGGFLGGLKKVAGLASLVPGPHQVFTVPISAASGLAEGIVNRHNQGREDDQSAAPVRSQNFAPMRNPYAGGFGQGMPQPYQNFLTNMQDTYGFPGQYTPTRQPTLGFNQSMGGSPSSSRGSYGDDSSGSLPGEEQERSGLNMYADGGMVDVPFEGFIPPTGDGMPESSGLVDDRVGLTKPSMSEVAPERQEEMQMLKQALLNMDDPQSQEIILAAVEKYGEEFVLKLAEEVARSGGDLDPELEGDRMVEMQFKQNLSNGGPVKIGAAIAPNEYVLPARQVAKIGGGDASRGAEKLKGLGSLLDSMQAGRPLTLSAE